MSHEIKRNAHHHAIPTEIRLDWEAVYGEIIDENKEPLVELTSGNRLSVKPRYFEIGIEGAINHCYLRSGVIKHLEKALALLPDEIGFLIFDGWRPLEVQEALLAQFTREMRHHRKDLTASEVDEIIANFVAKPSKDPAAPSPHLTGGSVDLTLYDFEANCALDMGSDFDSTTESSWSAYFESKPGEIRNNRRLLYHAMIGAGFSNLPSEWWHYDYGNQLWAHYRKKNAHYSTIYLNQ